MGGRPAGGCRFSVRCGRQVLYLSAEYMLGRQFRQNAGRRWARFLELVVPATEWMRQAAVLLVVTFRSDSLHRAHPLTDNGASQLLVP